MKKIFYFLLWLVPLIAFPSHSYNNQAFFPASYPAVVSGYRTTQYFSPLPSALSYGGVANLFISNPSSPPVVSIHWKTWIAYVIFAGIITIFLQRSQIKRTA